MQTHFVSQTSRQLNLTNKLMHDGLLQSLVQLLNAKSPQQNGWRGMSASLWMPRGNEIKRI